jgi:hypothetical protein
MKAGGGVKVRLSLHMYLASKLDGGEGLVSDPCRFMPGVRDSDNH